MSVCLPACPFLSLPPEAPTGPSAPRPLTISLSLSVCSTLWPSLWSALGLALLALPPSLSFSLSFFLSVCLSVSMYLTLSWCLSLCLDHTQDGCLSADPLWGHQACGIKFYITATARACQAFDGLLASTCSKYYYDYYYYAMAMTWQ